MTPRIEASRPQWDPDFLLPPRRPIQVDAARSAWVPVEDQGRRPVRVDAVRPSWEPVDELRSRPAQISAPAARWDEFAAMQPVHSIREFRGIDRRSPFAIHEGAATEAVNFDSRYYPALSVRTGYRFWGPALSGPIRFAHWWKLNIKMLALANGSLYERPTTDAEVAWTKVADGIDMGLLYYTGTDFIGNYPDSNVVFSDGKKLWRYDGSELKEITGAPKDNGRTVVNLASHRNRLWGSIRNRLYYSSLSNSEDWTAAGYGGSGIFEIDVPGEASIRAIRPLSGHLIVATRHSLWDLTGTGPDNWTMYNLSESVGVEGGHNCMIEVDGFLYWIAYDGIYRYAGGAQPDRSFSEPVRDYVTQFRGADEPIRLKASAATDGRYYVLALPLGEEATVPTIMLAYDTVYGIWHVWDHGVGIEHSAFTPGAGFMAWGCTDGRLRVKLRGSHGFVDGDNDPNPRPISWKWVSRPFGAGPLSARRWWYRLWLVVDLPVGSVMKIYVSPHAEGDDSWTLIQTLQPDSDLREHRIILPIPVLANANWVRLKLEGTGPARVYEIDFQERVLRHGIASEE